MCLNFINLSTLKHCFTLTPQNRCLKFARSGFISKNLYTLGLSNAYGFAIFQELRSSFQFDHFNSEKLNFFTKRDNLVITELSLLFLGRTLEKTKKSALDLRLVTFKQLWLLTVKKVKF
ncbi:hypothetical protein BpHYR1_048911 [Brachionus plicatilis]|uniref:Uncharacterized protein n=1 Tax=Brachionus plicatilis TaxID=10195 RepID=A0A3M7S184_BRAPC|nr:hypothetical protein BpHYR1_048911 [Brachionus plicatilis]